MGIGEIKYVKHQAQRLAKSKFSVNVSYKNPLAIYQPVTPENQLAVCYGVERKGKTIFTLFMHRIFSPKIFAILSDLMSKALHEVRGIPLSNY